MFIIYKFHLNPSMDEIAIHEKLDKSKKIRSRILSQGLIVNI